MPAYQPLPPRPNLEFERKTAKNLLRQLRGHEPEALARGRHGHPRLPETPQLSDAQLIIAREYGFSSWPRLVQYFEDLERQRQSPYVIHSDSRRESYEPRVGVLLTGYRERRASAARMLAAFVPRFYGMRFEDVLDSVLAEDEARLAVARAAGYSGWEDLVARTTTDTATNEQEPEDSPWRHVVRVMDALDLEGLKKLVNEHPDLLRPPALEAVRGRNLLNIALGRERRLGRKAMQPIMEWLAANGLDLQHELNLQLCGRLRMPTETVRELLDRGADPNWVAPNGVPVLEHALIRYWNAEAVDLLASRTTPRKAFWISAGLCDVAGVRPFLDRNGRPTVAARKLRPPFDLVGPMMFPHPEPDDEELLLEALLVAMFNSRVKVIEYLASRGTRLNSLVLGSPVLNIAVGNGWRLVVECLVRCGADPDLQSDDPNGTARDIARWMVEQFPQDPDRRRIAELCGLEPNGTRPATEGR